MAEIILKGGHITLVDDEDYEALKDCVWYRNHHSDVGIEYAYRLDDGRMQYMHRVLTSAPDRMQVDHINGNGLDNRKGNLRICTQAENKRNKGIPRNNTTGFKGVVAKNGKYRAQISVNGSTINLGTHNTPQEAADAYDRAAIEHFGEFALTNKQIRAARQSGSKKG